MAEFAVMPVEDYKATCDAIREKTDVTEAIKSGDMAALISAIESGGGVGVATGSFTLTSASATTPKLTHNLGTKKLIAMIWMQNDETFVPTAGYQAFAASFINAPAFFGDNIMVDCTGYNSSKFTEVSNVNYKSLSLGGVMRTPWTSQNSFTPCNTIASAISSSGITETTLQIAVGSSMVAKKTFNYIILGI